MRLNELKLKNYLTFITSYDTMYVKLNVKFIYEILDIKINMIIR